MTEEQIKENFFRVRNEIAEAAKKSGREASSVRLCAVSKFHPMEDVIAAINAGQVLFGENRVQEAHEKFSGVNSLCPNKTELHIIGSLQSNKVKKAVEIAQCIQSVDREKIVLEIEKHCAASGKNMDIFFEIHTGEESKSGFTSENDFFRLLEDFAEKKFPHINPRGLMTMAPLTEDENLIRKSFSYLRNLRERTDAEFPGLGIKELSMGMSADFRIAIEEGSSIVRVGTSLFGARNY